MKSAASSDGMVLHSDQGEQESHPIELIGKSLAPQIVRRNREKVRLLRARVIRLSSFDLQFGGGFVDDFNDVFDGGSDLRRLHDELESQVA